jgi:hypothetical protein
MYSHGYDEVPLSAGDEASRNAEQIRVFAATCQPG